MSIIEKRTSEAPEVGSFYDEDGFPWLENGERMDQKTFHERYLKTPPGFKAELIGGVVYVMASPLKLRHARTDANVTGWLYVYRVNTPGTVIQTNATTILGEEGEPQPDCALLVLPTYGGQTRDGDDDYTHGAPELVAEVAWSSRSLDLNAKLRDYERAGVREYFVRDLKKRAIHWFILVEGKFQPLAPGADGLFRSQVFPGLWLDPAALLAHDNRTVLAVLRRGLESPEHAEFVAALRRRHEEGAGPA